jgi:hypothetical protein
MQVTLLALAPDRQVRSASVGPAGFGRSGFGRSGRLPVGPASVGPAGFRSACPRPAPNPASSNVVPLLLLLRWF